MHALHATLVTLILSIVGTTTAASGDGVPQATKYIDSNSNITFLGYANKGYHFGMALPSDPKDDLIVQLVSPLKDGGGWGGIDFGASMTGPLMVVAWPNTAKANTVMISPRVATGYEIDNGANAYNSNPITITQIPDGTFVNDTHVSATFVCGGCLNADSFGAANKTATFGYAYAYDPVADPADPDTKLSDHTANGEPYGAFGVTVAQAQSGEYSTWAAMTGSAAAASGTAAAGASATGGAGAAAETGSSSSSSSSSSSGGGSSSSSSDYSDASGLSGGAIFALAGVGLIYVLQAVQIL
ncbi:hypothetical protein INS49_003534 [Diaporthe citri]|uniref:uncharacterized protein n=1 Tax=Diaporthe citri TaxID=83186 RepID=UPI001C7F3F19|nr:uncharacterized protein INS49_003534 [Diaporthe citri]KAG6355572.1 hypothetical protein INS49_003534 [Diaporthe citri]